MGEEKEEKTEEKAEKEKSDLTEKVRGNPWMLSSLILGVLAVVLLIVNFSGGITGKAISGNVAADNLIGYLNNVADSEVKLVDVASEGSNMYKVTVEYQGQDIDVYVTKDGGYYTPSLLSISDGGEGAEQQSQTTQEISRTDKPSVELYVFTYCPYGLQMEKAVIPVAKLLGDKINLKIRQIGAMHGEYEKVEAERQLCIEKNYPDKFLDYVLAFAEDTSCTSGSDTACVTAKVNSLFSKLGIDASKINSCMTSEGEKLYNAEVSNSQSKGVSGSPTLIINGVETSATRSPEGVKGVVCNAFSSVASECSQTLSTSQASAGFGAGTNSGSSAANCNVP